MRVVSNDMISVPRELLERIEYMIECPNLFFGSEKPGLLTELRALLAQPTTCTKDGGQCGLGGYCEPCHSVEHALRLEAERQVVEVREQLAKEAVWGRFAGWLLDHCEGQEIYEERLQYWLSEMLAHEKATSTEGKDHD